MMDVVFDMSVPKIGDFLLLTPALKDIQRHYPEAQFTVPEPLINLYKRENILKNVFTPHETKERLRKNPLPMVIDLTYPLLNFTPNYPGALTLDKRMFSGDSHVTEMYFKALSSLLPRLEFQHFQPGPFIYLNTTDETLAPFNLKSLTYITIHMGSDFFPKNWGDDNFEDLIWEISRKYSSLHIVGIFGPQDGDIFNKRSQPSNFTALRTSLENVADVLAGSLIHIDNDSGINHLAGALDVPSISIWGFTGPGTWGSLASEHFTLWGGPSCLQHCQGAEATECRERVCLSSIKVTDIMPAVDQIMDSYKTSFA